MSENTGASTWNIGDTMKLGTVGSCAPGVEMKIGDDGEILMRGPNVFLGYAKEPEATADALVDGWLHTGDLGAIDAQGFLTITGRKKEIIITAGGKNVAPKNIEAALKNHSAGEARRSSSATGAGFSRCSSRSTPTRSARFCRERGLGGEGSAATRHEHPAIVAEVQRALDVLNEDLARVEQVKKFRVLPNPFSVETGELTPTLKLKRRVVAQKFAAEIESMYAG